jgi:Ca2+:H+ antiporter
MAAATTEPRRSAFTIWHVLLLAVPATGVFLWLERVGPNPGTWTLYLFGAALISIIPLSQFMGGAVESLHGRINPRLAGLLDASLSNLPELGIGLVLLFHAARAMMAAQGGAADVIAKSTLTVGNDFQIILALAIGSVLNNVLLNLGVSVLFGARKKELTFDASNAASYSSMLALAVVGLALPTLAQSFSESKGAELNGTLQTVSLLVAGVLLATYIIFVLVSTFGWRETGATKPAPLPRAAQDGTGKIVLALVIFGALTLAAASIVGYTADTVIQAATNDPLTPLSVGLVLLPLACNFGELFSVLSSARTGNLEDGMEVVGGSAVQVPLLVLPILVFAAALTGLFVPGIFLSLIFSPLELIVLGLVTVIYALITQDGKASWLEGVELFAVFVLISATALAIH